MLQGTLAEDLIAALPDDLRALYDLDELLVADFYGELRWAIRQGSDWAFGPWLGPVFADAVLAGEYAWTRYGWNEDTAVWA